MHFEGLKLQSRFQERFALANRLQGDRGHHGRAVMRQGWESEDLGFKPQFKNPSLCKDDHIKTVRSQSKYFSYLYFIQLGFLCQFSGWNKLSAWRLQTNRHEVKKMSVESKAGKENFWLDLLIGCNPTWNEKGKAKKKHTLDGNCKKAPKIPQQKTILK